MARLAFEAVIYRQGILRVVDVPGEFAAQVIEEAKRPETHRKRLARVRDLLDERAARHRQDLPARERSEPG